MLRLQNHETPSRILRRIREAENDSDLPSLPSMASGDLSDEEDGNNGSSSSSNGSGSHLVKETGPKFSADATTEEGSNVGSNSLSALAGRGVQKRQRRPATLHQNMATDERDGNDSNDFSSSDVSNNNKSRNVLSPLRHNGANGAIHAMRNTSPKDAASFSYKGKERSRNSPDSSSTAAQDPVSAVSSNRTVRPVDHSPGYGRAVSETPSADPVRRRDTNLRGPSPSRALQDNREETNQWDPHSPSVSYLPDSNNRDLQGLDSFAEPIRAAEHRRQEPTAWSGIKRDDRNLPLKPTPLKRVAFQADASATDSSPARSNSEISLPPLLPPERNDGTFDYTSASPIAVPPQHAHQVDKNLERRGSSSSSSASEAASDVPQIQATPLPAPIVRAKRIIFRGTPAGRSDASIGTTPGIARRVPSEDLRNSPGLDSRLVEGETGTPSRDGSLDHYTSAAPSGSTPITAPSSGGSLKHAFAHSPQDVLTTPKATTSDAELERRKMHLLSTLRMTALKSSRKGLRLGRGTPHPRDRRSGTPGLGQLPEDSVVSFLGTDRISHPADDYTSMSGSSTMSEGSSNDLTTHARGQGNTSLPLVGGAASEGGLAGNARFNNAKLNNYLHTLNSHLTSENQNLIKTLEETAREVTRLLKDNERLQNQTGNPVSAGSTSERSSESHDADITHEMMESHKKTSDHISALHEHLSGSKSSNEPGLQEAIRQKDAELQKLRVQLEQSTAEVETMRKVVLRRDTNSDDPDSQSRVALQEEVFNLRDALSRMKAEQAVQTKEAAAIRSQLISQASRHTSLVAELHKCTDDLSSELEEKEAVIEELEDELVKQEEEFRSKMTNLEEELCKVMEEQEVQLRQARRDLDALKSEQEDRSLAADAAASPQLVQFREENIRLNSDLTEAREKLEQASAQIAALAQTASNEHDPGSPERAKTELLQVRMKELELVEQQLNRQCDRLREDAATAEQEYERRLTEVQKSLTQTEDRAAILERKLTSQSVLLRETERANTESERALVQFTQDAESARDNILALEERVTELQSNQADMLNSDIQQKYEAAVREIGNLKHQLVHPGPQNAGGIGASPDVKDLEIRTLRSSNHELETRVNQLKKQAMVTREHPSSYRDGTPARSERSVRFDTVKSFKTPRTASEMLAGTSYFDKTGNSSAANGTVTPLYAEVDKLNGQIRHYKTLLRSANDELDDKLRKLDNAGINVVSLAKELEVARQRLRELESDPSRGGRQESDIIRELRIVRDELTDERSMLQHRLRDIQEQCRQMAAQLYATHTREKPHQLCHDPKHTEVFGDRGSILEGVNALKRDLDRVQQDAKDLGRDIREIDPLVHRKNVVPGIDCQSDICMASASKSRKEAKGLLLMISYLKAKFVRESYFRADLAHQKLYLSLVISQKDRTIDATQNTLQRYGMPPTNDSLRPRLSLKIAGQAVLALIRMQKLASEWRRQALVKADLRDAYRRTRGKPLLVQ